MIYLVDPLSEYSIMFYSITLCSAVYVLFSQTVTRKFGNPDRVKQIQAEIADTNKRYSDALKTKDESKIKKAEADQGRIFTLMTESMKYQFIPLIVILPVLFVFAPILRGQFPLFEITLPISLPVLTGGFSLQWRSLFGAYGWFIVCAMFTGLLSYAIVEIFVKKKPKDLKK